MGSESEKWTAYDEVVDRIELVGSSVSERAWLKDALDACVTPIVELERLAERYGGVQIEHGVGIIYLPTGDFSYYGAGVDRLISREEAVALLNEVKGD